MDYYSKKDAAQVPSDQPAALPPQDDDNKCKLFVSHLDYAMTRDELQALFEQARAHATLFV